MGVQIEKNKIALVIYARFPSEMGYGNHNSSSKWVFKK